MSGSPTRMLSPWWALMLLPVGLLFGWLMGQLPTPKLKQPTAAAQSAAATVPEGAESPGTAAVIPDHAATLPPGSVEVGRRESEPADAPRRAEQAPSAEFSQWTTLDQAMAESNRNGKPVLIDFSADWCGPCRALRREVFDDAELGHTVQTLVIPVSIVDRSREEGRNSPDIERLQQRFQVDAFPTLVVLSPQSGRALRTQGFGDPDQTVAWITEAARAVR